MKLVPLTLACSLVCTLGYTPCTGGMFRIVAHAQEQGVEQIQSASPASVGEYGCFAFSAVAHVEDATSPIPSEKSSGCASGAACLENDDMRMPEERGSMQTHTHEWSTPTSTLTEIQPKQYDVPHTVDIQLFASRIHSRTIAKRE